MTSVRAQYINKVCKDYVKVVRCKDCKFWYKDEYSHLCAITGDLHPANWFCADGEQEEGDR